MKKKPFYAIYKPLPKENSGAALQLSADLNKQCLFLEIAAQKGPKLEIGDKNQFDWADKIIMKLDETDLSHLLMVLRSKKVEAKLFHTNADKTKSSILNLKKQTGQYDNFALHISRADKNKPEAKKSVSVYVDHHEALILESFFQRGIQVCLGF